MNNIFVNNLIRLSKYAGGRFDLVQASGGNVSWKSPDGILYIKSSGMAMSEIQSVEQFAQLPIKAVLGIVNNNTIQQETSKKTREILAQQSLYEANLTPQIRPSIETFLHALLFSYTLHTHPITVNHLVIDKDSEMILKAIFPASLFVAYDTPGIDLAIKMQHEINLYIQNYGRNPQLIFLKNHGLIVSADDPDEVIALTENVVKTIEHKIEVDYSRYRLATEIVALHNSLTNEYQIAKICDDKEIMHIWQNCPDLLKQLPTSPDVFVFNGFLPCEMYELTTKPLIEYYNEYGMYPKVVIYNGHLFFINYNVRKAKDMEDVFKFHLMVLYNTKGKVEHLSHSELLYLAEWEAEKYRMSV